MSIFASFNPLVTSSETKFRRSQSRPTHQQYKASGEF